jgi:fatty acid desaturase
MTRLRPAPRIKILSFAAAATLLCMGAVYLCWELLPPLVCVGVLIVLFVFMMIRTWIRNRAGQRKDFYR